MRVDLLPHLGVSHDAAVSHQRAGCVPLLGARCSHVHTACPAPVVVWQMRCVRKVRLPLQLAHAPLAVHAFPVPRRSACYMQPAREGGCYLPCERGEEGGGGHSVVLECKRHHRLVAAPGGGGGDGLLGDKELHVRAQHAHPLAAAGRVALLPRALACLLHGRQTAALRELLSRKAHRLAHLCFLHVLLHHLHLHNACLRIRSASPPGMCFAPATTSARGCRRRPASMLPPA
mmetsp:Transcript_26150/g.65966  ORF Transcript_26150/g.65966 Transcript_26150/m.65966 type:complete len:232 (+) Transcript_26150:2118-2813(+)